MSDTKPCICGAPNAECRRAGVPMVGRLWEICSASCGVPMGLSEQYRRHWDNMPPIEPPLDHNGLECAFIGRDTGKRRECTPCMEKTGNRVQLKVFFCTHPTHSFKPYTTLQDCKTCRDFNPHGKGEKPDNLADAVISRVDGGDILLDDRLRDIRLAKCAMCIHCHAGRCTHESFNADLDWAAAWQSHQCPLKKWPGDDSPPRLNLLQPASEIVTPSKGGCGCG